MLKHELEQALTKNTKDVMVIVGAGVTLGALWGTEQYPRASWAGLIRDGLAHAVGVGVLKQASAERIGTWLESDDPTMWIAVAEQLAKALGGPTGGELKNWLRRAVGGLESAIRERAVLDVLVDLERRGATIATVNYDGLLEQATGLRPVTWRRASEVERVLRKDARGILHLHGHWEEPESIVFGTSSYEDVVRDEHARTVLASMAMFKTLVFIGHGAGLADPNWGSFLAWTAKVFAGAEHRHFRIAREAELDELRTPELQAQRISLVGYPGGYENLGPFLRSLVPEGSMEMESVQPVAPIPRIAPTVEHVVLLVNIGENDHRFLPREDILGHGGVSEHAQVLEIRRVRDLKLAGPPQWRAIAKGIDELIDAAEQALRELKGPACLVIAGAAPIPVFAYLGHASKRLMAKVLFVNRNDTNSTWDRIGPFGGPSDFPPSLREIFALDEPTEFFEPAGKVALFVAGSTIYKCSPEALAPVTSAEGQPLRCSYRITTPVDHKASPMDAGDLGALRDLTSRALAAAQESSPRSTDLVLAYGGPVWGAFWLGRMLNPKASGNIDFPYFVMGKGYLRALASQMWRQRWIAGEPKILFLAAEPGDATRTRAGAQLTAIGDALGAERGPEARHGIHFVPSTTVDKLTVLLDREQPHILHVYAHGGVDGSLAFENDRGDEQVVSAERFLAALRSAGIRPDLAVACACNSAALAPELLEFADCVVAVNSKVSYKHAKVFMGAFYGALARGRSVAKAFDHSKAHVGLVLDPEKQLFELLSREGIDPADVYFWRPPS